MTSKAGVVGSGVGLDGSSVLCGSSSGSDAGSDGVLTGVSVCCGCSVCSVGLDASVAGFSLLSGAAVFGDAVDSASALSVGTSVTGSKEDAGGVLPSFLPFLLYRRFPQL